MDTPIDDCVVLYEINVDEKATLLGALEDEVDILYGQERSDEQA